MELEDVALVLDVMLSLSPPRLFTPFLPFTSCPENGALESKLDPFTVHQKISQIEFEAEETWLGSGKYYIACSRAGNLYYRRSSGGRISCWDPDKLIYHEWQRR